MKEITTRPFARNHEPSKHYINVTEVAKPVIVFKADDCGVNHIHVDTCWSWGL